MTQAVQTSSRPTNKLLATVSGFAVLTPLIGPFVEEQYVIWAPLFMQGPATAGFVQALIVGVLAGAIAYPIKDEANVPVPPAE